MCGAAASGKTSVGERLASTLGWSFLDLDEVAPPSGEATSPPFGALIDRERTEATPSRAPHDSIRYDALYSNGRLILAQAGDSRPLVDGHPELGLPGAGAPGIVLVAPFTLERMLPEAWGAALGLLGVSPPEAALIWVDTPATVTAQRMRRRAADRDTARINSENSAPSAGARLPRPTSNRGIPATPHLRSNGLLPVDRQVLRLLEALRRP